MGRRPELAQGPQAHRADRSRAAAPGKRLRDAAGVPRRHRRPGRGRDRARRLRSPPRPGRAAIARGRGLRARRRHATSARVAAMAAEARSAGVRVDRADRAVRARAAGRDRRAQRVDPADRRCAPPRSSSEGVAAAGIDAPVMVMRGDGGATDLAGFRRAPARTLYSGPAASVAGALRYTGVRDGVVVEVGGTSTNVAGVEAGRPSLSYVTGGQPRDRHARRRRAGDRRRRRLDAPGRGEARSTASGRAARTSPDCPTPASPTAALEGATRSRSSPVPVIPTTTSCSSSPTARASRSRTPARRTRLDPRSRRLLPGRSRGGTARARSSPAATSALRVTRSPGACSGPAARRCASS